MNLVREQYRDHTYGRLTFDGQLLQTLERPWIPTDPGGKPFESCVPAGDYELIRHTRPNGDEALALENPGLAVYYQAEDRPNGVGRYLILIHAGNWIKDIVGCIAPGLERANSIHGAMVMSSREAIGRIMAHHRNGMRLTITWG